MESSHWDWLGILHVIITSAFLSNQHHVGKKSLHQNWTLLLKINSVHVYMYRLLQKSHSFALNRDIKFKYRYTLVTANYICRLQEIIMWYFIGNWYLQTWLNHTGVHQKMTERRLIECTRDTEPSRIRKG